jgi:hypothetical protein
MDLVALGESVRSAVPAQLRPFEDGMTIAITGEDTGRITRGSGFRGIGESVRLIRDDAGAPRALWFGGVQLLPEHLLAREMTERYEG